MQCVSFQNTFFFFFYFSEGNHETEKYHCETYLVFNTLSKEIKFSPTDIARLALCDFNMRMQTYAVHNMETSPLLSIVIQKLSHGNQLPFMGEAVGVGSWFSLPASRCISLVNFLNWVGTSQTYTKWNRPSELARPKNFSIIIPTWSILVSAS